jgi:hypothetical protein
MVEELDLRYKEEEKASLPSTLSFLFAPRRSVTYSSAYAVKHFHLSCGQRRCDVFDLFSHKQTSMRTAYRRQPEM